MSLKSKYFREDIQRVVTSESCFDQITSVCSDVSLLYWDNWKIATCLQKLDSNIDEMLCRLKSSQHLLHISVSFMMKISEVLLRIYLTLSWRSSDEKAVGKHHFPNYASSLRCFTGETTIGTAKKWIYMCRNWGKKEIYSENDGFFFFITKHKSRGLASCQTIHFLFSVSKHCHTQSCPNELQNTPEVTLMLW